MAFISIMPRPAASATAAPDMPGENHAGDHIDLAQSAPDMADQGSGANRKIRSVMPLVFIRFPARMKKGMARSVNEVVEAYMRWATMVRMSGCPITTKVTRP